MSAIRRVAPDGVHRIVEVSFSDNADLDAAVAAPQAVIAAYATRDPRPDFDFWPMLFANLTIRLLGSDDFPPRTERLAAADPRARRRGARHPPRARRSRHERVGDRHEPGVRGRARNSTVVAVAPVEVLMIPGELFVREWFHPYEQRELAGLLGGIGGG